MDKHIVAELHALRQTIKAKALPIDRSVDREPETDPPLWGGADVVIVNDLDEATQDWLGAQPNVIISSQKTEPRRRAVVTSFAEELSWLFYRLRETCSEHLDHVSKYDFYGTLAQSAMDYLDRHRGTANQTELLSLVLATAEQWVRGEIRYKRGGGA